MTDHYEPPQVTTYGRIDRITQFGDSYGDWDGGWDFSWGH